MATTHTIRAGDTLAALARRFGVPLGVLIDTNGIKDPNKIKIGQVLTIPSMTTDLTGILVPPVPKPPPVASTLAINQKRFAMRPHVDFFAESQPKDLVVLHFTAGSSARSAFDTWTQQPVEVATAYVVDLDGAIYEFFDPRHWAFHLGVGTHNHREHRRSIGIEIVNVGALTPDAAKPSQLNWWTGQKHCDRSETTKYVDRAYRGPRFYAAYPDVQMASVAALVKHVCERFSIPKRLPPKTKQEEFDLNFAMGFSGVISHQTFRADKTDVGPAFDWGRLF